MYGDMILLSGPSGEISRAQRLPLGNTHGHNEAWIRDTFLAHPDILPIVEISPAFGPLIPLCRELRTPAGPVDAVFINHHGLLTLVECKLWRNPEARRKVVGQALDYASSISNWSYSDLQRQVAAATGRKGNVPYELAAAAHTELSEARFVDAVSEGLRRGRFLLLIAGDGIREDVEAMAELLDRNFSGGFSFGLVEVALYKGPDEKLIIQPRVIAKTSLIKRSPIDYWPARSHTESATPSALEESGEEPQTTADGESAQQAAYRRWWQPVMDMRFDDPDQEPPRLYWPNHVRSPLPWPRTWITAYRHRGNIAVSTGGFVDAMQDMQEWLSAEADEILQELPPGAAYRPPAPEMYMGFNIVRKIADFADDDHARLWCIDIMNRFANVLRPRVEQLWKRNLAAS